MSEIICITNRLLCKEDFLERIRKIAKLKPKGIILREKDLTECEYISLAENVMEICNNSKTECILHTFKNAAIYLKCRALHMPLNRLCEMTENEKRKFEVLGASCHNEEDAIKAEKLGCTYITAGHVFDTDCKKGLPGRGTDFLSRICQSVSIPVYGIGGINSKNFTELIVVGAAGGCVMSGAMNCNNAEEYFKAFEEIKNDI